MQRQSDPPPRSAGIGITNPYALEGFDISGLVVREFEPAIHFRALLLRPPGAASSLIVDAFIKALYAEQRRGHRL